MRKFSGYNPSKLYIMPRLYVKVSSITFLNEIRNGIRPQYISKVIKACLRFYLNNPDFKQTINEYIRTNREKVV